MNKLIFTLLAFVYAALVILNLIDTRDWHYVLGIDDGSIVVKSDMIPDIDTVEITTLGGPLIHVAHVNPNNYNQVIINGNQKFLSLDHGLTWTKMELSEKIYLATWVNNTILVSIGNAIDGKTFMVSEDFGVSWKPVTISTDSDELIMLPELSENLELSFKSIPLSSIDQEALSDVYVTLNRQGNPILQFSEESKYYFELSNQVLYIKEKYIEEDASPKIYRDNIQFEHGEIDAVLSVSSDGIWAATSGGVFFKAHNTSDWQDASASLGVHSFYPGFESQQGDKLLVLDGIGRLAMSENKGQSWKLLAKNVLKAAFLSDESITVIQQSGRVLLIDGDTRAEIAADWKLINNENPKTNTYLYPEDVYFIHGDKNGIWLTTGPSAYLPRTPIETGHFKAITQSSRSINDVTVYHYNRNDKQWNVQPWSAASEHNNAIEDRCDLSLSHDNIVSINGHQTSEYGTAKKVMLIESGSKYVYFDDSELYVSKLKNCKPTGIKSVWDFNEILSPAAYYETDDGLEVVYLSPYKNTIKRITINLDDSPPLWRWFFYFFYYQYGMYLLAIGLIIWFLNIRRKKPVMQV